MSRGSRGRSEVDLVDVADLSAVVAAVGHTVGVAVREIIPAGAQAAAISDPVSVVVGTPDWENGREPRRDTQSSIESGNSFRYDAGIGVTGSKPRPVLYFSPSNVASVHE